MTLSLYLLLAIQTASAPPLPLTIEEYVELRRIGDIAVAPDRAAVAFTVQQADVWAAQTQTRLHLWQPDAGVRTIAPERTDAARPRWSPDGEWIAFLSTAPLEGAAGTDAGSAPSEAAQVWLVRTGSEDEPRLLTRMPAGVLDHGWAPDGSSLFVLSREAETRVGTDERRELWRIAVPDGEAERLWRGDRGIVGFAVSPDGRYLAYSTNYSGLPEDDDRLDLWLFDVGSREARQLTDRPGPEIDPVWSPDGDLVVYRARQKAGVPGSQTELFQIAIEGGATRVLTDAFDRAVLRHDWPTDGPLVFSAALGAHAHLFAIGPNGGVVQLTRGAYEYGELDVAGGGATIYTIRESAAELPELWRVQDGGAERLTDLNPTTDRWRTARQEVIRWTAPDGLTVEGLLVYPVEYREGERYPLLLHPHGGPSSRVRDVFDQPALYQLFAAHGYAVLAPNFRGSIGYGETFGTAVREDLAGGDLIDLVSGVDHLVRIGLADPARIGIYGEGYGAYLAEWAITQTTGFSAAVSLAGLLAGGRPARGREGTPSTAVAGVPGRDARGRESPGRSPLQFANRVITPLLILDGGDAPAGSAAASEEMYRALRELGRPAERVEYAGQGGDPGSDRRIDVFFRMLRWFDRHLKFDGENRSEFYLIDDWVPGPHGWRLRVVRAEPRREYLDHGPADGRYLEVALELRPDTSRASVEFEGLDIDLAESVRLTTARDRALVPIGTVVDAFGERVLLPGRRRPIRLRLPDPNDPHGLTVVLAFAVEDEQAAYRLEVGEFPPVRLFLPAASSAAAR